LLSFSKKLNTHDLINGRKKMKIHGKLKCVVYTMAVTFLSSVPPAKAVTDMVNGSNCSAANLNQAFELQWNQARVINPITNTADRFVVCNISTGVTYFEDTNSFVTPANGGVVAWFDAGVTRSVDCIYRQVGFGQAGNASANSSAESISPPPSTPGTQGSFVGWSASRDGMTLIGESDTLTTVCKLPPGTGIQSINVFTQVPNPPSM
jgi:hypothetical protein